MATALKLTPSMSGFGYAFDGQINYMPIDMYIQSNSSKLESAGAVRVIFKNLSTNKKTSIEMNGHFEATGSAVSAIVFVHTDASADDLSWDAATKTLTGKLARGTSYEVTVEAVGKFNGIVGVTAGESLDLTLNPGSSGKAEISATVSTPA